MRIAQPSLVCVGFFLVFFRLSLFSVSGMKSSTSAWGLAMPDMFLGLCHRSPFFTVATGIGLANETAEWTCCYGQKVKLTCRQMSAGLDFIIFALSL